MLGYTIYVVPFAHLKTPLKQLPPNLWVTFYSYSYKPSCELGRSKIFYLDNFQSAGNAFRPSNHVRILVDGSVSWISSGRFKRCAESREFELTILRPFRRASRKLVIGNYRRPNLMIAVFYVNVWKHVRWQLTRRDNTRINPAKRYGVVISYRPWYSSWRRHRAMGRNKLRVSVSHIIVLLMVTEY